MVNDILRIIQAGLIGAIASMNGLTYKTVGFWIIMAIMVIQWVKEHNME